LKVHAWTGFFLHHFYHREIVDQLPSGNGLLRQQDEYEYVADVLLWLILALGIDCCAEKRTRIEGLRVAYLHYCAARKRPKVLVNAKGQQSTLVTPCFIALVKTPSSFAIVETG
jgi:hypothetical protein